MIHKDPKDIKPEKCVDCKYYAKREKCSNCQQLDIFEAKPTMWEKKED